MNTEIQERLTKYMDHLEAAATGVSDFASEQAPLVIDEYITLCLYNAVVAAVTIGLLTLCFLFSAFYCGVKQYRLRDEINDGAWGVAAAVICAVSALPIAFFVGSVLDIIKVIVAPRVVILEYIQRMI